MANKPPAIAGVLNVEVGSRSRIALSFGGSHSQKKFKCQSNPPLKYVETGSKLKSEDKSKVYRRVKRKIDIYHNMAIHNVIFTDY